jgi:hypothetical protein
MWPESTVYIIGGGESLKAMASVPLEEKDPKIVAEGLRRYFEPRLWDKRVIGVNDAVMLGPCVDVLFFGDVRFYWRNQAAVDAFGGIKVSLNLRVEGYEHETIEGRKGINIMQRGGLRGLEKERTHLAWNRSSGGAAINLAVHLGARRIILLGFDMKTGVHTSHFAPNAAKPTLKDETFEGWRDTMNHLASVLKAIGVTVLNATPGSALKAFPMVDFEATL